MTDLEKLLVCAGAAVALHFALARGLEQLPERHELAPPARLTIQVIEPPRPPPPPEPEPEKPPEPIEPPPTHVHEAPRHVKAPAIADKPVEAPPTDDAPVTTDTTTTPTFGVTMESTSQAGAGPAVPVGNTTRPEASRGSGAPVKPLAAPVAAFEATKMPLPQGRCYGKYTDEARAAGIEGTVVLDLIVGDDGRVREVTVVEGLGHGLDEAAIAALRACRFSPGEKDGKPVAVRVRGFKIRFVLQGE